MSKIIDFPKPLDPDSHILCCQTCGGMEFHLRINGDIECTECDTTYYGLAWGYDEDSEPPPPKHAA